MKTVTVITPSYNQGEFIEETIRSVLAQKGYFYIDYIIMDGGSTDDSVSTIRKYENILKRNCDVSEHSGMKLYVKRRDSFEWNNCMGISYRWISQRDEGQVDALKKGFKIAKGDVYCWLNSDDVFANLDVLERVTYYFEEEPELKMLSGDGIFISDTGEEIGTHHVDKINLKELLFLDYHIFQPSTFFSKDVYDEDYMDNSLECAFDSKFFIRILKNGVPCKKVNDTFAAFRFYEENKTNALRKYKYKESLEVTRNFSRNYFFIAISTVYRKAELIWRPFIKKKKGFRYKLFVSIRRLSYFLVTGKFKR